MTPRIFWQLMLKDLLQFKRVYISKLIDTTILFFTVVIVFGYFMTDVGVVSSYGVFIMIGAITSFALFDTVSHVGELIFDIEGDRKISYSLAMPIPYWVVFGQFAVKWALNNFLLGLPLFFIGKLLMWTKFDLTQINYGKFILIYTTNCLFFGFFSLWLTGVITNLKNLSSLYLRFINPIFMFGGYFYTWKSTLAISPTLGYFLLINPMMYTMEGIRAACLGQGEYISYWYCVGALWIYILLCALHSMRRLKRRLDCV